MNYTSEYLFNTFLLDKKRFEKTAEYQQEFASPLAAASRGYLDDIIDPLNTRWEIAKALDMLRHKQVANWPWKKHDNLPL